MAHGKFSIENDIFLIAIYMGTRLGWRKIEEDFRRRFGTQATYKDIESRWHKRLKDTDLVLAVDDFRHSGIVREDQHRDDILSVVAVLADYSAAERVF
ncbi:hypothetical protein DTO271G3_4020 [Paecilomyces variotii]|nr:hypothetical protein DTO271G3_4020 [Paecilomyces variotii]